MTDLMLDAEKASRSRLYPGHGVDTGTMRNRTHIAAQGHNWSGEHIDPVDGGGPDNLDRNGSSNLEFHPRITGCHVQ